MFLTDRPTHILTLTSDSMMKKGDMHKTVILKTGYTFLLLLLLQKRILKIIPLCLSPYKNNLALYLAARL